MVAWWRAFGADQRLEVLVLRRRGALAGVLPLRRHRSLTASLTNPESPHFDALGEDRDAVERMAEALLDEGDRHVFVEYLAAGGTGVSALRGAAARARYRVVERPLTRAPFVDTSGGWPEYRAGLSAKLLREVRRRRRLIAEEGELSLEVWQGATPVDDALQEHFELESLAWKGAAGTSILARAETRRFYTEIARWAAERGTLRVGFLRLDGRPIAADLSLEENGIHYLLKTGFDPSLRAFGPGIMMRHDMIARAFQEGLTSYEFLGTAEPWKLPWATGTRDSVHLHALSPTLRGYAAWAWIAHAKPLARRILRRS
jgi:CelD/BcsL family acetyltransferase involved in cellulose biosynthesis